MFQTFSATLPKRNKSSRDLNESSPLLSASSPPLSLDSSPARSKLNFNSPQTNGSSSSLHQNATLPSPGKLKAFQKELGSPPCDLGIPAIPPSVGSPLRPDSNGIPCTDSSSIHHAATLPLPGKLKVVQRDKGSPPCDLGIPTLPPTPPIEGKCCRIELDVILSSSLTQNGRLIRNEVTQTETQLKFVYYST